MVSKGQSHNNIEKLKAKTNLRGLEWGDWQKSKISFSFIQHILFKHLLTQYITDANNEQNQM